MARSQGTVFLLSLATAFWVFSAAVIAQAQNDSGSGAVLVAVEEMPVHEVNPGKLNVVVEAHGYLEAENTTDLYCMVEGQSNIRFLAPEGRVVKKGDLVCELDSSFLVDQLRNQEIAEQRSGAAYLNAKLSREVADIAVAEYVEGIFKQDQFTLKSEIAGSEAAIQRAEDRLERTQRASQQMSEAAKNAPKTPADIAAELSIVDRLEDAEQTLQRERKALEFAKAKLNVLEKYTREKTTKTLKLEAERKRTEEVSKKGAWLLEKSRLEKIKRQIESCRILAPRDGSIVYASDPGRLRGNFRAQIIEEGSTVRVRQRIASVIDLSGPMLANIKLPENRVDLVTPGLPVVVKVDSFPQTIFSGKVAMVAPLPDPAAMAAWDSKVYTARVRLDQTQLGLRPGMTTRVEIQISELINVLAVPAQAVIRLDSKDQVAIQRPDGGFEWRMVALGASNDAMKEVMSGLKRGDKVALQPSALLTEAQRQQIAASPTAPARPPRNQSGGDTRNRRPGNP